MSTHKAHNKITSSKLFWTAKNMRSSVRHLTRALSSSSACWKNKKPATVVLQLHAQRSRSTFSAISAAVAAKKARAELSALEGQEAQDNVAATTRAAVEAVLSQQPEVPLIPRAEKSQPNDEQPKEEKERPKLISLTKYMSQNGLCSRREADKYLEKGWVRLNGVIPTKDQYRINPKDIKSLELTHKGYLDQSKRATILLHKPLDVVSSQPESKNQIPAVRLLMASQQYKTGENGRPRNSQNNKGSGDKDPDPRNQKGWAVAGRLDANSTGLLVLTQSGKVAREIIGPNSMVEKEYLVRISSLMVNLDQKILALRKGVVVVVKDDDDDNHDQQSNEYEYKQTDATQDDDKKNNNKKKKNNADKRNNHQKTSGRKVRLKAVSVEKINEDQLRFVLRTGKKHQIRLMCKAVGIPITAIKRVRIGKVVLGDLPLGKWKYLPPNVRFA